MYAAIVSASREPWSILKLGVHPSSAGWKCCRVNREYKKAATAKAAACKAAQGTSPFLSYGIDGTFGYTGLVEQSA
jgi:hypothetical protein